MRSILPTVFIVTALVLFFGVITNYYDDVLRLRNENSQFESALSKSRELQEIRDKLTAKYNNFSQKDIDRLNKLLPESVDDVRLVLDIDTLARTQGMRPQGISIQRSEENEENGNGSRISVKNKEDKAFDSISVSFSAETSYENILSFLTELERSLQLIDITELSMAPVEDGQIGFDITLRTYWLK